MRIAEKMHDSIRSIRCEYCGKLFTPQGIQNHVASHMTNGHSKTLERENPSGRVVMMVGGTSQVAVVNRSSTPTAVDNDPSSQCHYCGYWFSPENYGDHVIWHEDNEEAALHKSEMRLMASKKNPKIIVQGPLSSQRANCYAVETALV